MPAWPSSRVWRFVDLPAVLAQRVRLKRRQRGCRDDQMLLSLIYSFCTGGGHLSDVDALAADRRLLRASGLRAAPNSRRLGEYLARMNQRALEGLLACVRQLSQRVAPYVIRRCVRELGLCAGVRRRQRDRSPRPPVNGQKLLHSFGQKLLHSCGVGRRWEASAGGI